MATASDAARLQRELVKIADVPGERVPQLKPPSVREPIGRSTGAADIQRGATGGGIASPLTEPDYLARTWHATRVLTSADGIFTIEYSAPSLLKLVDANGNACDIALADEPA